MTTDERVSIEIYAALRKQFEAHVTALQLRTAFVL